MPKLTLLCLLLQSLFIFQTVSCVKDVLEQKSAQTALAPGLVTNLFNGGLNIAKRCIVLTALQIEGAIHAGKAIYNGIQTYKETGDMTEAAKAASAAGLQNAIDVFMGIPGVKLSVTILNDFRNKESWRTIFMNGGRETIDMLPFGKRARLKTMATIQAIKDFNEAFQEALAEQSTGKKVEEKRELGETKLKEKIVSNVVVEDIVNNNGKEYPVSTTTKGRELLMAMTGLGAIQAIQEGKTVKEVVAEGIGGTLMGNACRHPSVLNLIAYYENKDKGNSNPSKNLAAKTRSG